METEELCAICLSPLKEDTDIYQLECNHTFHTDCIMTWFRKSNNGTCPCCLDGPITNNFYYNYYDPWHTNFYIDERYKVLKKQSRKKNQEKLKKNVHKISTKESELKQIKGDIRDIKKNEDYQRFVNDNRILYRKLNNKTNTIHRMKASIIAKYPTILYN